MPHPDRFLLAGVMGWPVMHSRSPMLHNYWFEHYGLAGSYVPLAIKPEGLHAALVALAPLGFSGCNLTIPHKQAAIPAMAEIDAVAKAIGAISCVTVRPDGSLVGSNNDCFGFIANLLEAQPDWRADAGPAIVIGAGGGARAVVYGLAEQGAREIRLTNRTRGRAETIATEFGGPIQVLDWDDRHAALDGAATLVNTTSLGLTGKPPLEIDLAALPEDAVVADIVYSPLETDLLAAARARGNMTVDGLGMLLHQAVPGFERWFGVRPKVTPELRAHVLASLQD